MLLAIDTGNTNTLFAIHDGEEWIVEWRIATDAKRTADEYAVWFYPIIIGEADVKIGIGLRHVNPKEVGADRLVTALGAIKRYKGNLIIIDSGTATTFDVISEDGYFEGGIISPGINLSVKALHEAAAQLPRIEIKKPEKVVGTSTVTAMQSGIFWGYIGLIDGLVENIISEQDRKFTVIGTGGVASLFEGASKTIQHYDTYLTIDGLLEIWRLNK